MARSKQKPIDKAQPSVVDEPVVDPPSTTVPEDIRDGIHIRVLWDDNKWYSAIVTKGDKRKTGRFHLAWPSGDGLESIEDLFPLDSTEALRFQVQPDVYRQLSFLHANASEREKITPHVQSPSSLFIPLKFLLSFTRLVE
jgi:hypothetical protein